MRGAGHTVPALALRDASTAPHQGARPHTCVLGPDSGGTGCTWGKERVTSTTRELRKGRRVKSHPACPPGLVVARLAHRGGCILV